MKSRVYFSTGSKLFFIERAELMREPMKDDLVDLPGGLYRVDSVRTSPVVFQRDGKTRRTGNDKLEAILKDKCSSQPQNVEVLLKGAQTIGAVKMSPGGIELPQSPSDIFEDLLFVEVKLHTKSVERLEAVVLKAHSPSPAGSSKPRSSSVKAGKLTLVHSRPSRSKLALARSRTSRSRRSR